MRKYQFNKKLIEICIWFHDIVYYPGRENNEEMSIEFFKKFIVNQ